MTVSRAKIQTLNLVSEILLNCLNQQAYAIFYTEAALGNVYTYIITNTHL